MDKSIAWSVGRGVIGPGQITLFPPGLGSAVGPLIDLSYPSPHDNLPVINRVIITPVERALVCRAVIANSLPSSSILEGLS